MGRMNITPIAHIRTDLPQKFGIPRNSFLAPHLQGTIVFEPEFAQPAAVAGLEEFTHLWLLWQFENGAPGGTAADIATDSASQKPAHALFPQFNSLAPLKAKHNQALLTRKPLPPIRLANAPAPSTAGRLRCGRRDWVGRRAWGCSPRAARFARTLWGSRA